MSDQKPAESYGLMPRFERAMAWCSCTSPQFFGAVTLSLDPQRLGDKVARLIVLAALAVSKDSDGRAPSGSLVVQQRLARWVGEGKLTQEDCNACSSSLSEEEFTGHDPDAIAREATPVLRKIIEQEAVRATIAAYGARGQEGAADFEKPEQLFRKARAVGKIDRTRGELLGADVLSEFTNTVADKLPTGIHDLDVVLGGGVDRSTLTMFGSGAKAGKSMWLCHVESSGLRVGMTVAHATLENSTKLCKARVVANLTSTPINVVLRDPTDPRLQQAWARVQPTIGKLYVKWFVPKVTSVPDIFEWVDSLEAELGHPIDVLVVDYLDKLGASNKKLVGEYEVQGAAADELRAGCVTRKLFGVTASQTRRTMGKERGMKYGVDDMADSQGKARVADLVITGSRPSETEVLLFVAGSRLDESGLEIGPLPHAFALGQYVPV